MLVPGGNGTWGIDTQGCQYLGLWVPEALVLWDFGTLGYLQPWVWVPRGFGTQWCWYPGKLVPRGIGTQSAGYPGFRGVSAQECQYLGYQYPGVWYLRVSVHRVPVPGVSVPGAPISRGSMSGHQYLGINNQISVAGGVSTLGINTGVSIPEYQYPVSVPGGDSNKAVSPQGYQYQGINTQW